MRKGSIFLEKKELSPGMKKKRPHARADAQPYSCAWLRAWLRAWLQVIVNRIKKREEKIIRARGTYFLTTNLTNLHESWGVDLRSLFLYGLMDLMDLLRTPWRVGALYLYGLIYISTDFWDFKDFCVHGSYGSTGFKVYGLSDAVV